MVVISSVALSNSPELRTPEASKDVRRAGVCLFCCGTYSFLTVFQRARISARKGTLAMECPSVIIPFPVSDGTFLIPSVFGDDLGSL